MDSLPLRWLRHLRPGMTPEQLSDFTSTELFTRTNHELI
jgi:hypothetical protein